MRDRKFKLNLFDIVFIAIVAVVAFVMLSSRGPGAGLISSDTQETVYYTIELVNLLPETAEKIKEGDSIMDKVEKRHMGTVESFEIEPYMTSYPDLINARYVMSEVPNRVTATLQIRAAASVSDSSISTSGFVIKCGAPITVTGPLYAGAGYIINIERDGNAT